MSIQITAAVRARGLFAALLAALLVNGCAASSPTSSRLSDTPRAAPLRAALPQQERAAPEEPALPAAPSAATAADELGARAGLTEYVAFAERHHPALRAAWQDWQASLEGVPQARGWPDPRLTYRYFLEPVETRVGPQNQALGLEQTFPWVGELSKEGEVADREARVARLRLDGVRLAVRADVRQAYAEHYFLARGVEVVRANVELYRRLESVLRIRYGLGSVDHADLVRAQVELGKLEDRLRSLEELRAPVAAALNAAIGRPLDAPLAAPAGIEHARPTESEAGLSEWLESANPELAGLDEEAQRQRAAIELARKRGKPDFTLGLEWIDTGAARAAGVPDSGQDAWILKLGFNLPVARGKYRAAEREAHARRASALERREDLSLRLQADARMALYHLRDAERKVDLYRSTLLPKARESLEATEKAFGLGTGSFLDLIDAQRVLLDFELAYERALSEHLQQRAELERLLGRPLPALPHEFSETGPPPEDAR